MIKYFPAIIERASSGFGVCFPDLPGCTGAGDSLHEAARKAEEGLQGHIDLMLGDGDVIPEPSALDVIEVESDVDEAARILVRAVLFHRKPVHVDLLLAEDLLVAVDVYAESTGFSRAGLINQAVRDLLREGRYKPLAALAA